MLTENPFPAVYTRQRPPAGQCAECGAVHAPESAHLPGERFRATFLAREGRLPLWGDLIAHLTGEARAYWERTMTELGIDPGESA